MKKLKTCALGALLALCCLQGTAQKQTTPPINEPDYNKPRLFNDLPAKMPLRLSSVEGTLRLSVGAAVNIQLADNFNFEGTIVSMDIENPALQSVVIRSTNKAGAVLSFARAINPDRTITYSGRIMSRSNGDAYEITYENGQYSLQKKGLYDLMNE